MKKTYVLGLIVAFSFGVVGKTLLDEMEYDVVATAYADVAGMGYRDLRRDRDFKKAVKYIVQNCYVDGESIYC
jgi:hypothetical protein